MVHLASSLFSLSDIQPLVGQTFSLRGSEPVEIAVTLSEVSSQGFHRPPEQGGHESFSLLFHAPVNLRITQGIFTFTHPQLGSHQLFLVPLGPDARGMRLEVIFNLS